MRFFNESTTLAITAEHNEYEEAEVTPELDEDNVVIIEPEKENIFSRLSAKIKDKFSKK